MEARGLEVRLALGAIAAGCCQTPAQYEVEVTYLSAWYSGMLTVKLGDRLHTGLVLDISGVEVLYTLYLPGTG